MAFLPATFALACQSKPTEALPPSKTETSQAGTLEVLQDAQSPIASPAPSNSPAIVTTIPAIDHSRLLELAGCNRHHLKSLVATGSTPDFEGMNGFWHVYNIGRASEVIGISQMLKHLDITSTTAFGTNYKVHQLPHSMLTHGGWEPVVDANGNMIVESTFGVSRPSGFGPFGHAVNGIYRNGNNPPCFPGKRVVTRIVQLDVDLMLGQSTLKVGRQFIPVGFFALQRAPVTLAETTSPTPAIKDIPAEDATTKAESILEQE